MVHNYLDNSAMNAMDRAYYSSLDSWGSIYHPSSAHDDDGGPKHEHNLGPRELGTTINPMQNQLVALQAKIREGAGRMEIGFGGVGKGNSQMATPEAYGYEEREALRQLAEYNDIRTSTHASFQLSGLAGFGDNGFDKRNQHRITEEVRKAVDFASQATTGGAVVVHTGEWARPMTEATWATKDFAKEFGDKPAYRTFPGEAEKAFLPVVDKRTGEIIGGIRKDQEIFEPKWVLAKDFKKVTGKNLAGVDLDGNSVQYQDDDFVDVDGVWLNPTKERDLFRRMPLFNETETRFESEKITWDKLVERTAKFNERYHTDYLPEQMFARIQLENQALQARGSSLFYGKEYKSLSDQHEKYKKALEFANKLGDSLPPDEQWKMVRTYGGGELLGDFIPKESEDVRKILDEQIKQTERQMRHIHESSGSADAQATTLMQRVENLQSIEDYGLAQSGKALAELGVYAMEKSIAMKNAAKQRHADPKKFDNIYIAPENVFPEQFGSHPDELMKIVQAGRDQMVKELMEKRHKSLSEAQELAKEHIKSTIDIGHLNMWKTYMERKQGESDEVFNKRFENWALGKIDEMHKKGMLGHFHLTDNLGFNDEHLTPGQGNAPIRGFVEFLAKRGYKDFIMEIGSFNAGTILGDTWSYLGAKDFRGSGRQWGDRFNSMHARHFGGYAPPNYMVGAYVPSNEFTLWSGLPLE